jgi:hypothetical protein
MVLFLDNMFINHRITDVKLKQDYYIPLFTCIFHIMMYVRNNEISFRLYSTGKGGFISQYIFLKDANLIFPDPR